MPDKLESEDDVPAGALRSRQARAKAAQPEAEPRQGPLTEGSLTEGSLTKALLTTGDMARHSGSTLRTVRFYEEAGLLEPQERTEGGHRLFAGCELRKLNLISDLRAAGFSLEEIKELLTAKDQASCGADAATYLIAKLDQRLATIDTRISALERVRLALTTAKEKVADCSDCETSPLFPAHCGKCERMAEPVAPELDVLWKVHR